MEQTRVEGGGGGKKGTRGRNLMFRSFVSGDLVIARRRGPRTPSPASRPQTFQLNTEALN